MGTWLFWTAFILTRPLGATVGDLLTKAHEHGGFNLSRFSCSAVIAFFIFFCILFTLIILQIAVRRYIAWIYWLAVVMVAIFGTMTADVLHVVLGISYLASTLFFAGALAVIFLVWYNVEKTLSIHSITTRRRELFYWATIMATFALGTAAGDMTAATFHLGYFASGILFAVLFALPALAYWLVGLNEIVAFWLAYIITRPLGASFADWFGKPSLDGLGLGDTWVSLVLTILIAFFVGYLTITRRDSKSA